VSQYQKVKTNLDLLEQEIVSGSGISWAICKSASHPRQITMPEPNHSVFYKPDVLPAAQPTVSKRKTKIIVAQQNRLGQCGHVSRKKWEWLGKMHDLESGRHET